MMGLFRTAAPPILRLRFVTRDSITGAVGTKAGAEIAVEISDGDGELVGAFSIGDAHVLLTSRGYRPLLIVPGVWIADGQADQPLWSKEGAA